METAVLAFTCFVAGFLVSSTLRQRAFLQALQAVKAEWEKAEATVALAESLLEKAKKATNH